MTTVDCGLCSGSGRHDDEPCPGCRGHGLLVVDPDADEDSAERFRPLTDAEVEDVIGQGAVTASPQQASALDRTKYIGSSDAPQIAGVSSYGTALSVWMSKVGLGGDDQPSLRMWIGERLEPIVLDLYAAREGRKPPRVVGPDDPPMLSSEHPFIGAHPDYERLEIKTTANKRGWGDDGEVATLDNMTIPLSHFVQVQHQLYVTGWDWSDVAVLIGHDDIRTYKVPADADFIGRLVIAEVELWGHVQSGEPPPDDDPKSREALLKVKYPHADLPPRPATPEDQVLLAAWREARAALDEADTAYKRAQNDVREAIGKARGLIGEVSYPTINSTSLDRNVLRDELRRIGRLDIIERATKRKQYRRMTDTRTEDE